MAHFLNDKGSRISKSIQKKPLGEPIVVGVWGGKGLKVGPNDPSAATIQDLGSDSGSNRWFRLTGKKVANVMVEARNPADRAVWDFFQLSISPAATTTSPDPVAGIRQNAAYVERRVVSVGITGWGGPFRLDVDADLQTGVPRRSFHIPRSKVVLSGDPFAGKTELALTDTIHPSETAALNAVSASPYNRPGFLLYAHYRGPEGVILPTVLSSTTTPQLVKALRLAVDQERRDALGASDLLVEVFITLSGLRSVPRPRPTSAVAELDVLRATADQLVRAQRGRVVINLVGAGEVPGAINVNALLDQRVRGIPNLVKTYVERIGEVFRPGVADRIVSNNAVLGTVNWIPTAKGAFTILKPGGTVSIYPYAARIAEHLEDIANALRRAGFQNVRIVNKVGVEAVK